MNVLCERFIEKAIKKHGDLYDYSNIDYVNGRTKIILNCKEHGDFTITPAYHLKGGICPMCAKQRMLLALKRPKSEEQKRKRRETMLARYGATTFAGSKYAHDLHDKGEGGLWSKESYQKQANTMLEKFGAKTWAESEVGRKHASEIRQSEEVRKYMSEVAKSDVARQHYKETSLRNHGATHWTKSAKGNEKLRKIVNTPEERLARSQRMLSTEVREKIEATSMARYGTPYYWQCDEGRKRLKFLLNSEDVVEKTKQTCLERYGSESWSSSNIGRQTLSDLLSQDEIQQKIIESKKRNGTINDSKSERDLHQMLINYFGENDIECQYRSERYPYKCDFYIKSRDIFIELNAYWMHGGHWFDINNEADVEKLQVWIDKSNESYERAIYVWSENDLEKRKIALDNKLNYVVFWDADLTDAKHWFQIGCPDNFDMSII